MEKTEMNINYNDKNPRILYYTLQRKVEIDDLIAALKQVDGLKLTKVEVNEDVDADVGMHFYGNSEYSIEEFSSEKLHAGSWGTRIGIEGLWHEQCIRFSIGDCYGYSMNKIHVLADADDFELPENFEEFIPE